MHGKKHTDTLVKLITNCHQSMAEFICLFSQYCVCKRQTIDRVTDAFDSVLKVWHISMKFFSGS